MDHLSLTKTFSTSWKSRRTSTKKRPYKKRSKIIEFIPPLFVCAISRANRVRKETEELKAEVAFLAEVGTDFGVEPQRRVLSRSSCGISECWDNCVFIFIRE